MLITPDFFLRRTIKLRGSQERDAATVNVEASDNGTSFTQPIAVPLPGRSTGYPALPPQIRT